MRLAHYYTGRYGALQVARSAEIANASKQEWARTSASSSTVVASEEALDLVIVES